MATLALSPCNGSDTIEGRFTSSGAVAGLTYTTATQAGITDSMGAFYYDAGETITFSLGDTVLGEAVAAKAAMTPLDLVPGAVLYTTYAQLSHVLDTLSATSSERQAFNKFSNILSFLQTLDDDANPSNGININSGMATLFSGVQIEFEQSVDGFDDDNRLRVITHQATTQGLLSTADIKKMGVALDHFYSEQSLSHNLAVKRTEDNDTDADGSPDNIRTYTYDANGNLLTESYDDDADGSLDSIDTYTYDANSNLLTESYDDDADGSSDGIETYTYDTNGNRLTYSYDMNGDGSLDEIKTYTYTYDANGNILTYGDDSYGDGTPDIIRTYVYQNATWVAVLNGIF
ncbi:MAG: hypothetical protein GY820_12130 [Gammaproteobacteria bacterium]|nr:hypothetical protein [Gammaproteobacteria bacterium]